MKTRSQKSKAQPSEALAENFRQQLLETARRCLAMRRQFPGAVCRWRRAARTGLNSDLALVFIWRKGEPPQTEVWPYAKIEQLAAGITDEEARAELARSAGDSDAESTE